MWLLYVQLNVWLTDVCCETSAQKLFSLSFLRLASVTSVLKVPQGCLKMLHVILQLINTAREMKTEEVNLPDHRTACRAYLVIH